MKEARHYNSDVVVGERTDDGEFGSQQFIGVSGMYRVNVTAFEGTTPDARVAGVSLSVESAEQLIAQLRRAITTVTFNQRTGRIGS